MDNFKTVYLILAILEKALDGGLDLRDLAPETLRVSERRRNSLLIMLQEEGYITGLKFVDAIGLHDIRLEDVRITLKGLEYLQENSMMKKAYRALKRVKDITPGF